MFTVEECWTLVGRRRGRVWLGRRVRYRSGRRDQVTFDAKWVLRREESKGDVLGFLHTHPPGHCSPSARDVRTMRAWCGSFGKPMLCVIMSEGVVKGFRFNDDESEGDPLDAVELFDRNMLVGVDDHARKTAS